MNKKGPPISAMNSKINKLHSTLGLLVPIILLALTSGCASPNRVEIVDSSTYQPCQSGQVRVKRWVKGELTCVDEASLCKNVDTIVIEPDGSFSCRNEPGLSREGKESVFYLEFLLYLGIVLAALGL